MAIGDKKYVGLVEDWGRPNSPATLDENGTLTQEQWPALDDFGAADRVLGNLTDPVQAIANLGAAPAEKVGLKTFYTLAQLAAYTGVDASTITDLKTLFEAMPAGSYLINGTGLGDWAGISLADSEGNNPGAGNGVLEIVKYNGARNAIRVSRSTVSAENARFSFSSYQQENNIILPWKELDLSTGYLPLTGGTLTGNMVINHEGVDCFSIKRTLSGVETDLTMYPTGTALNGKTAGYIRLGRGGEAAAYLRFNETGIELTDKVNGVYHTILHTGNKPSGSYTGNGDATERVIDTGGIGNVVEIHSSKGSAIVNAVNGLCYNSSTTEVLASTKAKMVAGVITLATAHDLLNASGVTYYYQVL